MHSQLVFAAFQLLLAMIIDSVVQSFSRAHHGWAQEKVSNLVSQDAWKMLFWDDIFDIEFRNKELFHKSLTQIIYYVKSE